MQFMSPDEDDEEREMSISDPMALETYVAIADYDAADKSEVSLKDGMQIEVFEKNNNGESWVIFSSRC